MSIKKLMGWISGSLVVGTFGLLFLLERRQPLRHPVESKLRRTGRNLAIAAAGALVIQLVEKPVANSLTSLVERRRLGLLKRLHLPVFLEVPLAVLLLDYTLYLWHILTHRVPWLWRFHLAHHVDLDLDVSTALRFHFGELLMSVPWRAGQILFIGVSPLSLSIWQTGLLLSILFHHSNVELPVEVEARLVRFIVTPRMHGIHHSVVRAETDSNFSSGLTIWDLMHGTLKLNVPQQTVTIGVPAYRDPVELTLGEVLELPFGEERPSWESTDDVDLLRRDWPGDAGHLAR
ncbi:MAG: sterol desaturase family protein [Blastocatellia bacterium]|nr:sterol desaturase family protein [Blastocatellia bacterium]